MNRSKDRKKGRLSTTVGTLSLHSPLIAASGTCSFGKELDECGVLPELGAFITKTVTMEPRRGNPPPRICETCAGMINSIGLANPGFDHFRNTIVPELAGRRCTCIVNIGGRNKEEFVRLARSLDESPVPRALELNLSCPNVTAGGMDLSRSPENLARLTKAVRAVWDRPLWVKLTPNVTDIGELVHAAAENGADAVVTANTYLGMAVDWRKRRSRIGRQMGGFSGPAVKPLTLRLTRQAVETNRLPVVASGGVATAEDVLDYLVCGASAVQLGSLLLRDPFSPPRINAALQRLLQEEGIAHLADIINTLETP